MRKLLLFSAVLSLFLLVPALITRAQVTKTLNGVVRYESGMSKSTLTTPNGDVLVNLPQSMTGSVITGTVSVQPGGETEKEKNKNLKELLKMLVNLDGQNIPLTASPSNFDWLTHLDRSARTPLELLNVSGNKIAEVSLPQVLPAPAASVWQTDRTPLLTTPSNILVKGDALNIYTDQQFKPGEKFVITDAKGQQFTVKPLCLSANQAVINVPEGVVPGELTVIEEIWNQPVSKFDVSRAHVNMIDINLTSPNTNLLKGENSSVTLTVKSKENLSGLDSNEFMVFRVKTVEHLPDGNEHLVFSIDLRNLNPNTVTMEGGNLQRLIFPLIHPPPNDVSNLSDYFQFQIKRNIIGNDVGTFSVSATLHEDYNTCNDPFRPQLNVLKIPEDFNAWANALKKDLKEYAGILQSDAGVALNSDVVRFNVQRAIDNMPVCTSPEQLDESKAVAYSLLQPLNVPKGAANTWLSSFEAFKSSIASFSGTEEMSKPFHFNIEIAVNGLDFMERMAYRGKDSSLILDVASARQLVNSIKEPGESNDKLNQLNLVLTSLSSRTNNKLMSAPDAENRSKLAMADMRFSTWCFEKRTKDGIDPVKSVIALLDPETKTLNVNPEYRQQVLNSLNAVPVGDDIYRINTVTAFLTPVSYNIKVAPLVMLNPYMGALWDWWQKLPVPDDDPRTPNPKTVKDINGTPCIFYKDAKCEPVGKSDKPVTTNCRQEVVRREIFKPAPPRKEGYIPPRPESYTPPKYEIVGIPGSYYKYTNYPRGRCIKGTSICKEVYTIGQEWKTFSDAECTIPVNNTISYFLSCL